MFLLDANVISEINKAHASSASPVTTTLTNRSASLTPANHLATPALHRCA